MPYHGVTICRNRHVVNLYKDNASKFCPICGAETYSKCPHCNTSIKGLWYSPDVLDFRPHLMMSLHFVKSVQPLTHGQRRYWRMP